MDPFFHTEQSQDTASIDLYYWFFADCLAQIKITFMR